MMQLQSYGQSVGNHEYIGVAGVMATLLGEWWRADAHSHLPRGAARSHGDWGCTLAAPLQS